MIIAVDTGGTKTLVTRFSSNGNLETSIKFPTPRDTEDYFSELFKTIDAIRGDTTVETISVGVPGIVEDGVARFCRNLGWENVPIRAKIEAYLPNAHVFVENDANLAGLAETRYCSLVPQSSVYVTFSTGIGTGIITGGNIDPALRLSEGGDMLFEYNGQLATWESFASGAAIYAVYGKLAKDITDPNDWHAIADRMSRGLLAITALLQPEIVIVGGSVGSYFERFSSQLQTILNKKLPTHIRTPQLIQAQHPEEAVVYGCYYHAIDQSATG